MNYIILDIQSIKILPSMFKTEEIPALVNFRSAEILRISAIKLDENFKELSTYTNFVNPQIYDSIPKELLKYRYSKVNFKNGISFVSTIDSLKEFMGNNCVIVTYDPRCLIAIKRNCSYYNLDDLWIGKYIFLQSEISKILNLDKSDNISLENTIDYFNIKTNKARKNFIDYGIEILESITSNENFNGFSLLDSNELKTEFKIKEPPKEDHSIDFKNEIHYKSDDEYKWKIECPNCGNKFEEFIHTQHKYRHDKGIGVCQECKSIIYHRNNIRQNKDGELRNSISDVVLEENEYQQLMEWVKWD